MRRLRHPITVFVVIVLAVIGAGVGVLAATVPPAHTTPAVSQHPPIPPSSPRLDSCIGRKPTGLTTAQATRIINRVNVIAGDQLQMTAACSGGPVLIGLHPGDEELAHQLLVDYGRNMAVMVGLTIYNGSPGRSPRCGRLTPSAALPLGLHLALQLQRKSVRSGGNFSGAVLVRPGTLQVVGIDSEVIAGGGDLTQLTPGEASTIPVVGGTARCDGGLGSALPPGTYQVIVRVAPEGRHPYPAYLTPPEPIRVTA
jgi:hypothetical protein